MNELEKEFVLYQEALALKKLGFDEPCFAFFQKEYAESKPTMVDDDNEYRITGYRTCKNSEMTKHYTSAPTYSQAFKFFRKKYGLIGWVEGKRFYRYCIESSIPTDNQLNMSPFPTYEVAEIACLKQLIEIVKNK